jgi:hypothetical protein
VVAIDQSGSMAEISVVYAAVFGATLASIRSVKTSVVAFDTEDCRSHRQAVRSGRCPLRLPDSAAAQISIVPWRTANS